MISLWNPCGCHLNIRFFYWKIFLGYLKSWTPWVSWLNSPSHSLLLYSSYLLHVRFTNPSHIKGHTPSIPHWSYPLCYIYSWHITMFFHDTIVSVTPHKTLITYWFVHGFSICSTIWNISKKHSADYVGFMAKAHSGYSYPVDLRNKCYWSKSQGSLCMPSAICKIVIITHGCYHGNRHHAILLVNYKTDFIKADAEQDRVTMNGISSEMPFPITKTLCKETPKFRQILQHGNRPFKNEFHTFLLYEWYVCHIYHISLCFRGTIEKIMFIVDHWTFKVLGTA